jgi:hypothetical protein
LSAVHIPSTFDRKSVSANLTKMQSNESILLVLLIVLIVVVACQGRGGGQGGGGQGSGGQHDAFASSSVMSPYTPIRMQDGALRGARHDAFNQDHAYHTADLAKNYRAWATKPRDLEEAQRAAWFEAVSSGENSHYNTEAGGYAADELTQHHTPGPSINYQETLVDLVAPVDGRMRAQQENWHSEVAAKSQTAMAVDNLDEASAISNYRGHGLYSFRFAAPSQHNPLMVTDQDAETYGVHSTRFSFGG